MGRIHTVTDELDLLDPGLRALSDLEDEIDAVVRKLDDLRFDPNVETTAAAVDLDQTRRVSLNNRPRERSTLL